jgi:hypothetical protein
LSSPRISGGSQRRFCSSLPNTTTGLSPKMFMCTADAPDMPAPDCAIACIMIAASVTPRPAPPYCSGIRNPEPPVAGERLMKIQREAACRVLLQPVIGIEPGADLLDRGADRELIGRE